MDMQGVPAAIAAAFLWSGCSSSIIMLNKHIMADDGLNFQYPFTLASMGVLMTSLAATIVISSRRQEGKRKYSLSIGWKKYMFGVLPCALCNAVTMNFGNRAYFSLSVSFIQMLKSFTPVVTLIVSIAIGTGFPEIRVMAPTVVVALGCFLASYSEEKFAITGFLYFIVSMVSEALRVNLMQKLLGREKLGPIESLYYISPACLSFLLVGVVSHEWEGLVSSDDGGLNIILGNKLMFLFASILGYMTNFSTVLLIRATSALTFKVVGTAKNVCVVLFGIFIFRDKVGIAQSIGFGISLLGLLWYNYAKASQTPMGRLRKDKQK